MRFSEILQQLFFINDIKVGYMAQKLGYDISYISKWLNGAKLPSAKNIVEILQKISRFIADEADFAKYDAMNRQFHFGLKSGGEDIDKKELENSLQILLLCAFYEQRERDLEKKKEIPPDINHILWRNNVMTYSKVGDLLSDIWLHTDKDMDIIVSYPFLKSEKKNLDFFSKLKSVADTKRAVHIHQFINFKKFENDIDTYCKCIFTYIPDVCSVEYEFYPISDSLSQVPVLILQNKLLMTDILEPFTQKRHLLITRDSSVISTYFDAASQYLQTTPLLVEKYSPQQMRQEKYFYDYIMQNQYQYLLKVMHIIHMPDDMLLELCQSVLSDQNFAESHYQLTRHSFQGQVTVVLFKTTLMNYIFDGKIALFGRSVILDKAHRIRHIRHLIDQIHTNPNLHICLLDNNNPYIQYDELKCSFYFSKETIFAMSLADSGTRYYRFMSKEMIRLCNIYYERLLQKDSEYTLYGEQLAEFFRQGLTFLE